MGKDPDPRISTPIPRDLLSEIDDFQAAEALPSRAEAIRRLIELGLRNAKGEVAEI